ncbi:DUF4363 family protein [Agathobaculum sp. NTUH-O15-33]|uniref:DUF4363 family protein n=1 Tax=Agathobaculum sp. NTUH-O15-33 TaxID=3079302 RepID=UPI002958431E|nr:DUF4363 family protein [Agathobaculum sp. NTUH-O15-33]WNX86334.1 DUF4363 family protein [Agathobaculum sp. NTUH-O15-33]
MRRLFISLALLAVLIGGCIWSDHTLEHTIDAIKTEVKADRLDEAMALWTNAESLLGSLLPHEEIDETDRLFSRVQRAKSTGAEQELAIERAELIGQLTHLPELDSISIKNIF